VQADRDTDTAVRNRVLNSRLREFMTRALSNLRAVRESA
jgi:hypothetical protein